MKDTLAVDPRFDLENCAHTLRSILIDGLKIERAHFVGHDRGCIIMDNMLGEPRYGIATLEDLKVGLNLKKNGLS